MTFAEAPRSLVLESAADPFLTLGSPRNRPVTDALLLDNWVGEESPGGADTASKHASFLVVGESRCNEIPSP